MGDLLTQASYQRVFQYMHHASTASQPTIKKTKSKKENGQDLDTFSYSAGKKDAAADKCLRLIIE